MHQRALLRVLVIAAAALQIACSAPLASGPVLVSAAISLTDALIEVERAFRSGGGDPVRFNFAGSNVLARQIINGAPADLFISADGAQMNLVEGGGAVERPIALLGNRLAVVTPRGQGGRVPDLATLASLRRIAVADPSAVPAGVYARAYLQRAGVWEAVEPRLLPLANVRAALNAVEAGGVDAGIVYESDAAASRNVDLAFIPDGPAAPRIVYPAAVVRRARNRDGALRFLEYLRSPEAAEIFRRYKFQPLNGTIPAP